MTSRDFCYWLQGFFELTCADAHVDDISPKRMAVIRNHLNMVFKHEIDPSHGDAAHQQVLSEAHTGGGGHSKPPKYRC